MLGFNPDQQKKTQVRKKKGAGKDQQNSASNLNAENPAIAGGGLIQGPGTGTSDDIQTQMPAGSYIMPADSTEQIGEEGLAGLGSPADVRVSNGEYQLPPEQVHAIGVQALDQMKDATHTPVAQGFNPQVNRDGEQFFNQGGQVLDEEEAKRKAAQMQNQSPIAPPPQSSSPAASAEQLNAERANRLGAQKEADAAMRSEQRKAGARAIENTKSNVSAAVDSIGGFVGDTYKNVLNAATVIPRTAYGIATGEIDPHQPARHPGADIVDANKAKLAEQAALSQQRNQQFSATIGGAQSQMDAVSGLFPNQKPAASGTPMQAIEASQPVAETGTGQEIASQQAADQTGGSRPANEPLQTRHGTDFSRQQPKPDPETGYVTRTDQQRRDFARSNIVDGVPTLNSQMAKTIDPNSINTMGSQAMSRGFNPQTSQALSGALSAAADRGDWDAVNRHYQSQGQGFAGMGAPGQGQGTRVTVVPDPTRTPSNAEIMQQRLESARMRNADAGRRTDIEGQRVSAGIDSDLFQNSIRSRQADIAERGQDLSERQSEVAIAQQQEMQRLYKEYDEADDQGKERIAKRIQVINSRSTPENLRNNFMQLGGGQEMVDGVLRNVPQRLVDLRTGQEIGGSQNQLPPLSQNPDVQRIIADKKLSKEQKAEQIRALGYK